MKLKQEPKHSQVMTTSHVLVQGAAITYVYYDEEGEWQLFSDDTQAEEEEAYMVSVEEILEMEPLLASLPSLAKGQAATLHPEGKYWVLLEEG